MHCTDIISNDICKWSISLKTEGTKHRSQVIVLSTEYRRYPNHFVKANLRPN